MTTEKNWIDGFIEATERNWMGTDHPYREVLELRMGLKAAWVLMDDRQRTRFTLLPEVEALVAGAIEPKAGEESLVSLTASITEEDLRDEDIDPDELRAALPQASFQRYLKDQLPRDLHRWIIEDLVRQMDRTLNEDDNDSFSPGR